MLISFLTCPQPGRIQELHAQSELLSSLPLLQPCAPNPKNLKEAPCVLSKQFLKDFIPLLRQSFARVRPALLNTTRKYSTPRRVYACAGREASSCTPSS